MAQDNHGNQILHSLKGRQLGLDHRGMIVGAMDRRVGTETITSTAASTLAAAGTSVLKATASAVYELIPPAANMIGARKRLINGSTAAVAMLAKLTAGNFLTATGTTNNTVSLSTRSAYVDLEYISTALVAVCVPPTTGLTYSLISFSTTT